MSKQGETVDGVRWDRTEQWECTVWVHGSVAWVGNTMDASSVADGIRVGRDLAAQMMAKKAAVMERSPAIFPADFRAGFNHARSFVQTTPEGAQDAR